MQIRMTALLVSLLVLAAVLFILNEYAQVHFLYWRLWWYDIMMHFLGGVVVGGLAAALLVRLMPSLSWRAMLGGVVVSILAVGIGWEIFEYAAGMFAGVDNIVGDTLLDLVMDTLGALSAYGVVMSVARGSVRSVQ